MEMRFEFNLSIVLQAFIHDGGQNQAGYEKDAKALTNNFKSFFSNGSNLFLLRCCLSFMSFKT